MAFTVLFLAHAPDADPERDKCVVETSGKLKLIVRIVKDQAQAVEVSKKLAQTEGVHSILLCPGFTHRDVAEICNAVGPEVGVSVARPDGPSRKVTQEVMAREGWFAG